ncbi:hypothetical protein IAD21_05107 [Abditibacteriota bacterium]|nr:hypothetical protein IAD21_05107 [Abditibacteriota bacterium]
MICERKVSGARRFGFARVETFRKMEMTRIFSMKISSLLRAPLLGVLTALVLSSTTLPLRPAQAQAQTIQIGVVDEDKLADGFKKYADAVAAIDKRAQDLDSKIPAREFLTLDESKTFDDAIIKSVSATAPNPALDNLVKQGLDRRAEYQGLIGKAVRSDAENSRMTVLQGYATQNRAALSQLSDQLLQLVRQQQDDTDKKFTDQANSVVAQVATDKKLLMIVRKKALIYSSDAVDVTAEVLNRLNK